MDKDIHNSSLTSRELTAQAKLETAVDLIKNHKVQGNAVKALAIIQEVIREFRQV